MHALFCGENPYVIIVDNSCPAFILLLLSEPRPPAHIPAIKSGFNCNYGHTDPPDLSFLGTPVLTAGRFLRFCTRARVFRIYSIAARCAAKEISEIRRDIRRDFHRESGEYPELPLQIITSGKLHRCDDATENRKHCSNERSFRRFPSLSHLFLVNCCWSLVKNPVLNTRPSYYSFSTNHLT